MPRELIRRMFDQLMRRAVWRNWISYIGLLICVTSFFSFFFLVLLDMFASYCTGREDAKNSIRIAERQFQRIYR